MSISFFVFSLNLFINDLEMFIELNLLSFSTFSMNFILLIDWISVLFMSFVLFITSMILKYSEEYMSGDLYNKRFIILMVMFVVSMMLMILSMNLISILLGWDGLGLVSYALVIYYQNIKSYNAGMITLLSNRVGDAAILSSIVWMFDFGSWNFLFYLEKFKIDNYMWMISMFLILAAITKSAQIPFSSWLPAAMAAPTPVSSLVHSSTLVTAGVYLLIRIIEVIPQVMLSLLLYLSLFTMFMAGFCANFEYDLKKIIALSTLSQLGMMMVILCLGDFKLAFFHLLVHALFKALLFMCAGTIIHNLGNCQDIRFMGGLISFFPLTSICLNISNLSLCGLPFMSGFYSKDLIMEILSMNLNSVFVYFIFYLSIGLTVSYSLRLTYYIFFSNIFINSLLVLNEDNNSILLKGMMGLVFFVIIMGSLMSWMFISPYFIILPFFMKMLSVLMILLGGYLGWELNNSNLFYKLKKLMIYNFSMFMGNLWNMPILSVSVFNYLVLLMGKIYTQKMDQGWLEYYGGQKISYNLVLLNKKIQLLSKNHVKLMILLFFLYLIMFMFF
uniref:NADH-ubiquinone oxidoreductase chain 5 n=1 Tax=Phloeotribus sp. BMNH 1047247 TaxID=1903799 RepID=A0A343A5H7_9CUCU|nr:NADH dehydrogenase subunit 5 [Phloeotribus sp. BMNH 1047247]